MHKIICRTEGCGFDGAPSEVEDPAPLIYCAGCESQIADISPPVPEPEPEPESPAE